MRPDVSNIIPSPHTIYISISFELLQPVSNGVCVCFSFSSMVSIFYWSRLSYGYTNVTHFAVIEQLQ